LGALVLFSPLRGCVPIALPPLTDVTLDLPSIEGVDPTVPRGSGGSWLRDDTTRSLSDDTLIRDDTGARVTTPDVSEIDRRVWVDGVDSRRSIEVDRDIVSDRTVDGTIDQAIDQTLERTTDQMLDQTSDQTIDRTTDQTIDESLDQTTDQTIDQTTDQTTDQTVDQTSATSDTTLTADGLGSEDAGLDALPADADALGTSAPMDEPVDAALEGAPDALPDEGIDPALDGALDVTGETDAVPMDGPEDEPRDPLLDPTDASAAEATEGVDATDLALGADAIDGAAGTDAADGQGDDRSTPTAADGGEVQSEGPGVAEDATRAGTVAEPAGAGAAGGETSAQPASAGAGGAVDPAAAPTRGGAPRASGAGGASAGWQTVTSLQDPKTGLPIQMEYSAQDGAGQLRLRKHDGSICQAGATVSRQDGRLVTQSNEDIRCPDGTNFGRPRVECQTGADGLARCVGRNPDGSTFTFDVTDAEAAGDPR
jgi:hypothetical protein